MTLSINYPQNPTVGQTFSVNGIELEWDGVKWVAQVKKLPQNRVVESVAQLRTTEGVFDREHITLKSYHGDGGDGGGILTWYSDDTRDDNGGTIFECTGVATGRWVREHKYEVYVSWFGAKGDATRPSTSSPTATPYGTDDTQAIYNARNYVQEIAFQPNFFVGFWGGYSLCFEPNRAYRVRGNNVLGTTQPRDDGTPSNEGSLSRQNYWVDGKGCFILWEVENEDDTFIESHETFTRQGYKNFSVYACLVEGHKGTFYSNIANDGRNATTIHKFDRVEVYHSQPSSVDNGLKYMFYYTGNNLGDRLITERCSFNQAKTFFYSENLEAVQQSFRGTTFASYLTGTVFFHLRRHGSTFNFSSGTGFLMKGDQQTLFKTEYLTGLNASSNGATTHMDVSGCRLESASGKLQTIADCAFGVLDIKGVTMTAGGLPADNSVFCKTKDTGVVLFRASHVHGRIQVGSIGTNFTVDRAWAVKLVNCMFTSDIAQSIYTENSVGDVVNIRDAITSNAGFAAPAVIIEDTHTKSINWQGRTIDNNSYIMNNAYFGYSDAQGHNVGKKIIVGQWRGDVGYTYLRSQEHIVLPPLSVITGMRITHNGVNTSDLDELVIKVGSAELSVPLTSSNVYNKELLTDKLIVISDIVKSERLVQTEIKLAGGTPNSTFFIGFLELEYRPAVSRNEVTTTEVGGVRLSRILG